MIVMRKIYAIYCVVQLAEQSDWLPYFREKYDEMYPFHITLKQMAYIDDDDYIKVKLKLENVLNKTNLHRSDLRLVFDTIVLEANDSNDNKGYIYLFASKRNKNLDSLQNEVREELADFSNYLLQESQKYEHDFKPHLTIARKLKEAMFAKALSELPKNASCAGEVINITLSLVKELSVEEATKSENFTVYRLNP